jgi:hypothetical protein
MARLRGRHELRRGLGIALGQLEQEGQAVACVHLARLGREDAAVCVDGAGDITLGVAHDAEAVARVERLGLGSEHTLQLFAGRRPLLARDQHARQGQAQWQGIGLAAEPGAQLFRRGVEIAHGGERGAEPGARIHLVGLGAERLAEGGGRGHHLPTCEQRSTAVERGRRGDGGPRDGCGWQWRCRHGRRGRARWRRAPG